MNQIADVNHACNFEKLHHYPPSSAAEKFFNVFDQATSLTTRMSFRLPDRTMSFATATPLYYETTDIDE